MNFNSRNYDFEKPNLDLGGWVDSFSRCVHLDRSTERSTHLRRLPPIFKHCFSERSGNNALAISQWLPPSAPVWRGDKKRFNRWSRPDPPCPTGCLSKGRAGYRITSEMCLSPNNGIFRPFFTATMRLAKTYTTKQESSCKTSWRVKDTQRWQFISFIADEPSPRGNSPWTKLTVWVL